MQIPLKVPELVRQFGNMFAQKPAVSDSTNTFLASTLVRLASGVLILVATDDVTVYGITPDVSHAATELPPAALFGENHYVFDLLGAEIEINIAALSANAPVIGASAKTIADIAIGGQYAIATATSGIYAGYQFLDPTDTTNKLFQVIAIADGMATGDYNPRVRCKILPSCIQG